MGLGNLGAYDRKISEMASLAKRDQHRSNGSRALHAFIHRKKQTLPVQIDAVEIPIKINSRHKIAQRPWPVCYLSSWCRTCMEDRKYAGFFLLGGHRVNNIHEVESMLTRFWRNYQVVEPGLPQHPQRTIGFYIHGDEGRGQCKRPLLIISFQPLIPWCGENEANSSQ